MIGLSGSLLIARADPVPSRPGVRMLRMPRLVRTLAGAIVAPMRFKQHAAGLALAICVLLPASAAAQTAGFVYTLFNINGAPNLLFGSALGQDGSLTDLPGFPIGTGGNGQLFYGFQALYYDAANGRLYALNGGSNSMSAWTVNGVTGALTSMPFSPLALPPGSFPIWACVTANPSGSVVIVADGNAARLASYKVTGSTATPAAGDPVFHLARLAELLYVQPGRRVLLHRRRWHGILGGLFGKPKHGCVDRFTWFPVPRADRAKTRLPNRQRRASVRRHPLSQRGARLHDRERCSHRCRRQPIPEHIVRVAWTAASVRVLPDDRVGPRRFADQRLGLGDHADDGRLAGRHRRDFPPYLGARQPR